MVQNKRGCPEITFLTWTPMATLYKSTDPIKLLVFCLFFFPLAFFIAWICFSLPLYSWYRPEFTSNYQMYEWVKVTESCPTLCNPMDYTVHGILQVRILEWVTLPFSRGSSQPRDLNSGIRHCRRILYQLSHQESLRILEWVAYPFSSGSSPPRNWTRDSCIASRFFTSWANREALSNV